MDRSPSSSRTPGRGPPGASDRPAPGVSLSMSARCPVRLHRTFGPKIVLPWCDEDRSRERGAAASARARVGPGEVRLSRQAEPVADAPHRRDPRGESGSGSIFRRTRRTCSVTVERPCHSSVEPHTRSRRSSREKTWPGEAARKARRSNSLRVMGSLSLTVTVRVSRSTTSVAVVDDSVAAGSPLPRRRTARTRASSSAKENGLTTKSSAPRFSVRIRRPLSRGPSRR